MGILFHQGANIWDKDYDSGPLNGSRPDGESAMEL
jgi:hypothetical protein